VHLGKSSFEESKRCRRYGIHTTWKCAYACMHIQVRCRALTAWKAVNLLHTNKWVNDGPWQSLSWRQNVHPRQNFRLIAAFKLLIISRSRCDNKTSESIFKMGLAAPKRSVVCCETLASDLILTQSVGGSLYNQTQTTTTGHATQTPLARRSCEPPAGNQASTSEPRMPPTPSTTRPPAPPTSRSY
jgi:hypothetical protein